MTEVGNERELALGFMRRQPLFEGLEEQDLQRLFEMSSVCSLEAGEVLLRQGEPGDEMYIIMSGELEVSRRQAGQETFLASRGPGDVIGEMALLEQEPRSASVRAVADSRLLVIDRQAFVTLLDCSPTASLTILRTVVQRLRTSESVLMQQEKLSSLGTMAAGLAHQLNNPAAAASRNVRLLEEAVAGWEESIRQLSRVDWTESLLDAFGEVVNAPDAGTREEEESAVRAREEELGEWLQASGIAGAWELAADLAANGWSRETLEPKLAPFPQENRGLVASWLAGKARIHALLEDTAVSTRAISEVVAAVRDHTYLNRAPLQEVDVRHGLDSTLTILASKLKSGVEVVREYAPDLPVIEAYGGELNQVWTNLIDNAIDAMDGRGELRLRAYRLGEQVAVEIRDDGPGIPAEALPRIFDPFFTTKPVGSGTGLGLHIAYDLVVRRHRGRLSVQSEPGSTCFQVVLPLRQENAGG